MINTLINPTWSMTPEQFTKSKENVSKEIFERVSDSGTRKDNHAQAAEYAEWLNFNGTPWWNCHHTGNRCSKDCNRFTPASSGLQNYTISKDIFIVDGFCCHD